MRPKGMVNWNAYGMPHRYAWRLYLLDNLFDKYKGKPHGPRMIQHHRRKFSTIEKCMAYAEQHEDEYAVFCAKERMGLL